MTEKETPMQTPSFRFEWNPNTILMLLGFASGLVAWGYTFAEIKQDSAATKASIARIEARVDRLETNSAVMGNHELRITNLEKHALETTAEIRSANKTLDTLSSDVRLATEILRRIENAQSQEKRDSPSSATR